MAPLKCVLLPLLLFIFAERHNVPSALISLGQLNAPRSTGWYNRLNAAAAVPGTNQVSEAANRPNAAAHRQRAVSAAMRSITGYTNREHERSTNIPYIHQLVPHSEDTTC